MGLIAAEAWASDEGLPPLEEWGTTDNGDGTWSYEVPVGVSFPETRQGAWFRERYEGQQRYSHDPQPMTVARFTVQEPRERSLVEQVSDIVSVDRYGRRWRAEDVDEAALLAWLVVVDEAEGVPEHDAAARDLPALAGYEPGDPVGTVVEWTPDSWTQHSCGEGPRTMSIWNSDGRVQLMDASLTNRQKTAVRVRVGVSSCAGVILRQRFVLTAAHCLTDSNGNLTSDLGRVCRYEPGVGCLDVDAVYYDSANWGGSGHSDYAHDWMVLKLESTWVAAGKPVAETMTMSAHSDTTLSALNTVRNLARPGYLTNSGGTYCVTASGTSNRLYLNLENEPIASVNSNHLRLKIERTKGHSGSPYFFCPDGNVQQCGKDEPGFVYGVHSTGRLFGLNYRAVGPKVPAFRNAALAWINNQ